MSRRAAPSPGDDAQRPALGAGALPRPQDHPDPLAADEREPAQVDRHDRPAVPSRRGSPPPRPAPRPGPGPPRTHRTAPPGSSPASMRSPPSGAAGPLHSVSSRDQRHSFALPAGSRRTAQSGSAAGCARRRPARNPSAPSTLRSWRMASPHRDERAGRDALLPPSRPRDAPELLQLRAPDLHVVHDAGRGGRPLPGVRPRRTGRRGRPDAGGPGARGPGARGDLADRHHGARGGQRAGVPGGDGPGRDRPRARRRAGRAGRRPLRLGGRRRRVVPHGHRGLPARGAHPHRRSTCGCCGCWAARWSATPGAARMLLDLLRGDPVGVGRGAAREPRLAHDRRVGRRVRPDGRPVPARAPARRGPARVERRRPAPAEPGHHVRAAGDLRRRAHRRHPGRRGGRLHPVRLRQGPPGLRRASPSRGGRSRPPCSSAPSSSGSAVSLAQPSSPTRSTNAATRSIDAWMSSGWQASTLEWT